MSRSRFSAGEPTLKRPDMARHVIPNRRIHRPEIKLQQSLLMQPPEIGAGLRGVFGDEPRIVVVEDARIFVRQADGGRRLGDDDLVPLANRFGQQREILGGQPCGLDRWPPSKSWPFPRPAGRAEHRRPRRCAPGRPPAHRRAAGRDSSRRCRRSRAPCGRCGASGASVGAARRGAESFVRRIAAAFAPEQCRTFFPRATAPADCRSPNSPAGCTALPTALRISKRARHPIARLQAVRRHVGRLRLDHQLRNIDAGRALQAALVAVDAQIGHVLEIVGRHERRIELAGQQPAKQIGLRPRRGLFGRRDAKDRAHPQVGRLCAARAAAVAARRDGGDLAPTSN